MRVFLDIGGVRSSARTLDGLAQNGAGLANWARGVPLPEMPGPIRAEAESTLRARVGRGTGDGATHLAEAARELGIRADIAEAQQSGGRGGRLKAFGLQFALLAGGGAGHRALEGFDRLGNLVGGLGKEARGRPINPIRALGAGSLGRRAEKLGRWFAQTQRRAVHKAWDATWRAAGKRIPSWRSVAPKIKTAGRVLGITGTVSSVVLAGQEMAGLARQGQWGRVVTHGLGSALVITAGKNPIVGIVDIATGGSVSGYVNVVADVVGGSGADEITARVQKGDYGPLPQWEDRYISQPLSNFIWTTAMGH